MKAFSSGQNSSSPIRERMRTADSETPSRNSSSLTSRVIRALCVPILRSMSASTS